MKLRIILTAIIALVIASAAAIAGSVTITPGSPDTDDTLTATVSGSTATYNFYWYKDGAPYSKTTGKQATVPSYATEGGQIWTAKAFVPSSGYMPETFVGEASVFIALDIPAVTRDACDDWIDNDGDGLVDMSDPGCSSTTDNDEYNAPPQPNQCEDGLDNDNDGLTDMNDPGCTSTTDNDEYNPPEPTYQCSDNTDNDGDGLTDMNDPGCTSTTDNDEYNEPEPEDNDICDIEKVWVNGFQLTGKQLEVELGETLNFEAQIKCDQNKDLRLVASIYGGEYEDIQADTGLFTVKPGITYVKSLTLKIPEVMNTENNKIRLRLMDSQQAQKSEYLIYIKEKRHNIAVTDIITSSAQAGKPLFIKVRAENQGYKTEEDIKVTASFLGMTASTYIDKLESFRKEGDTGTANLYIAIPSDTATGDYELEITLSYGKEKATSKKTIKLAGKAAIQSTDGKTLATITQLPERLTIWKKEEIKVMLVNIAGSAKAYSLEVKGAEWADVAYEQLVAVKAGAAAETKIMLTPKEKGDREITIQVKENGIVIAEYTAKAKVVGPLRAHVVAIGGIGAILLLASLVLTIRSVTRKDPEEASFY